MAAWIRKSTKIFNIHLAQTPQEVSNGQTNALLLSKEKSQTALNAFQKGHDKNIALRIAIK